MDQVGKPQGSNGKLLGASLFILVIVVLIAAIASQGTGTSTNSSPAVDAPPAPAADADAAAATAAAAAAAEAAPPASQAVIYAPPSSTQVERAAGEVARVYKGEGLSGLSHYAQSCYTALEAAPAFKGLDFCLAFDALSTAVARSSAPEEVRTPGSWFALSEVRQLEAAKSVGGTEADPAARVADIRMLMEQVLRRKAAEAAANQTDDAASPTVPAAPTP